MFNTLSRKSWFVDAKGNLCKIIRSFEDRVIFQDGKRTRVTSMGRFNAEFEPVDGYELHRIQREIEDAENIKRLRTMRR